MKKVGKPVFFITAILVLAFTVTSFTGIKTQYGDRKDVYLKGADDIRWGIDVRGGVDVTFSPPPDYNASESDMSAAESVIKQRLIAQNITDYELYTDIAKSRIILRFPWKSDEADFNPEKAINELGSTALLTFREGVNLDPQTGLPTSEMPEAVILEGKDVESASAVYTSSYQGGPTDQPAVQLELKSSGTDKFAEATGRMRGQVISIWMDDSLISYPVVNDQITGGKAFITGSFTQQEAKDLADKINGGALPFKLQTENYNTISPTLGMGAKDAMVLAGIIAFIIIALFMIIYYRLPGSIAVICLAGQVGFMIAALTGYLAPFPSFTLTLPGIAGIILSIGMGVDANVIIGERIREEIQSGKTIDGALELGYKRAFTAIFDGNITVIIVSIVLMGSFGPPSSLFAGLLKPLFFIFGMSGPATTGTIYSFGFTLLVGVIANFVMGILASQLLIKSLSKFKPFRKTWLYGGKKSWTNFNFMGNSKKFFAISIVLVAAVVICTGVLGPRLDIMFKGGSMITYSYDGDLDVNAFGAKADSLLSTKVSVRESTDIATQMKTVVVTLPGSQSMSSDQMASFTQQLQDAYPANNLRSVQINNVNPSIGSDFLKKSIVAMAFAALLMILYVAFRFRRIGGLSAGVMAVIALLHDVAIVFGVFVVFRISIDNNFIAVILTILGYSVNDTIVIYDRIRENRRISGSKSSIGELVDTSINQSFKRSLNTSLTTIASMIVVSIVAYVYNVTTIQSFAIPMIFGLIAGTYSSICIAGPLWVKWQEYQLKKKSV